MHVQDVYVCLIYLFECKHDALGCGAIQPVGRVLFGHEPE